MILGINKILNLSVYSLTHALVDATCAALIFNFLKIDFFNYEYFFYLVVLYNVIAFGSQAILGLAVDKLKNPKGAALLGCLLVVLAILVYNIFPILTFILVGLGNSLFHIGGGTVSLNIKKNSAFYPGLFVAPGAIGLFLGGWAGKSGNFNPQLFILFFAFAILFITLLKIPSIDYERKKIKLPEDAWEAIILLILFSVFIRSLVGSILVFSWKENLSLAFFLVLAITLGKAFGGFLADKIGFQKVVLIVLILSAPLLSFCSNNPFLAIVGSFLFQMAMPITLTATAALLPGRPAFAFGLTCLALIIGALPAFFSVKLFLSNAWAILFLIGLAIFSLRVGFKMFFKYKII